MMCRVLFFSSLLSCSASAFAQSIDQSGSDDRTVYPPIYVTQDRPDEAPGLSLNIDSLTLSALSPDHPAEALNSLPAVNIQMNSGQEHLISLRSPVLTGGAGQGSFLILENGLPTRSSTFGNVNALFEPVHELATSIEIVAGPGSAKYGSNAVHGLLNFSLPRPAGVESHIHIAASSLGRQKLDSLLLPNDSVLLGLAVQKDNGWRDSTGVDQQKVYLAGEFEIGGWKAFAWASATNLNQETGDFLQGTRAYRNRDIAKSNDDPSAYRDARSARAAIQFVREGKRAQWRVTPYARWQEMEFRQHFLPYRGIEENGHDAFGLQTRLDWTASDKVDWRIGFDADFANGYLIETQPEPFGFFPGDTRFPQGVHYDYEVDSEVVAIWGELDAEISERLSFLFGLRAEAHTYDYQTAAPVGINGRFNVVADRSDDFDFVAPKFGFVYELNNAAEVFGNIARGARAPQASDLYRLQSQQLPGAADVETLDSIEIGARGEFGANGFGYYQIAGYVSEKDNFFFRDSDGLNVSDGTTEHTGVDALFVLTPIDQLTLSGSISWADHNYTFKRLANGIVDGNAIDTAPEWLADISADWQMTKRWSIRGEAEYIGEYFTNPANTQDYPGHVIFHAATKYQLNDGLELYARVRNLFDLKYANRADFAFGNERYFPGEPVNVTFGVRKIFDN